MLLLHTSYKFNEDLIAMCVCVLTGEDKGAGSEASSAVSIAFQSKEGLCARVLFELVCQYV